jgi:hypothetical protein
MARLKAVPFVCGTPSVLRSPFGSAYPFGLISVSAWLSCRWKKGGIFGACGNALDREIAAKWENDTKVRGGNS